MTNCVRAVVALCVLVTVQLCTAQDVLVSPPDEDNTITWVACAADDSNYASMNVRDDVSKIDLDYTSFTDIEISPCEGELVMKFGQQVTFGEDGTDEPREGAIRYNEESDSTDDLEFRKNGEWVSLTTYIADSESKVLPGNRIPHRNQRLFYVNFTGTTVFANQIPSVPIRTVPITGEIVTVLHGLNAFFCDIAVDRTCNNSRVVGLDAIIGDVDIDSSSNTLFTESGAGLAPQRLGSSFAAELRYFLCNNPLCSSFTPNTVSTPERVRSVPITVTLPSNVFHTFFYTEDMDLMRYSSFDDSFHYVLNNSRMDTGAFLEFVGAEVDHERFLYDIARNETAGASVDDYYFVSMIPLLSSEANSTIPGVISSFNDAVWRLLVLQCSEASGCPNEDTTFPRDFVPTGVSDFLLLGALDSDTSRYSHDPLALQATMVDDNGTSRLFIVAAIRRAEQDAPPRELNQALVSIVGILCNNNNCSDYSVTLLTDSNDWHDSNQVSNENGLFDEMTIRVEASELTGWPVIAVTSLRSAPFVISCADAGCTDAEFTVLEERLTVRTRDLRLKALVATTTDSLHIMASKRGIAGGFQYTPTDAFPIALHAGPDFITVARLGESEFEVDDLTDNFGITPITGDQRALLLQFANATVSPDGVTPCTSSSVGQFLNAAGKIFACTRLPKKPLENNIGDSDAIISATRLYQWSPIGGNVRHQLSTHVLANEGDFENDRFYNPDFIKYYTTTTTFGGT